MDCSICYAEITAATGKVELSCSHSYHFSCLTSWFDKQLCQGSNETCPLCRHAANEFEKMPVCECGNEEEDDDEDEEGEVEEWEEPTLDQLAARERASGKFQHLKTTMSAEDMQIHAASLIKACWRGYQDRLLYAELLEIKNYIQHDERKLADARKNLALDIQARRFLKSLIGLSRYEVKNLAASKIQFIWRRHKVEAAIGSMSGLWRKIRPGKWEKVIMNPEEDEPTTFVGLTPPSGN